MDKHTMRKALEIKVAIAKETNAGIIHLTAEDAESLIGMLGEQDFSGKNAGKWISVKDRLPAETHSLFWPWRDSAKWIKAMWEEQSDKVIVAILFKDGTRIVRTGETHDGKWHTDVSMTLEPVVTHWMPFPELPKE